VSLGATYTTSNGSRVSSLSVGAHAGVILKS
jgi:hypothetical protein